MAEKQEDKTLPVIVALVAIVPTVITALTGYFAYQAKTEIEAVTTRLQALESQRKFDLQIYQEVRDSLVSKDLRQQTAALALVVTLGQDPLRCALIRTFDEALTADPDIGALARTYLAQTGVECPNLDDDEAVPVPVEASVEPPPFEPPPIEPSIEPDMSAPEPLFAWGDWDFDLFYCESSPARARDEAGAVMEALEAQGAQGRIRVRALEEQVNARSGYQITGNVIRRGAGEEAVAEALAGVIEDVSGAVDIQPSGQDTPWYVSAFFCP